MNRGFSRLIFNVGSSEQQVLAVDVIGGTQEFLEAFNVRGSRKFVLSDHEFTLNLKTLRRQRRLAICGQVAGRKFKTHQGSA